MTRDTQSKSSNKRTRKDEEVQKKKKRVANSDSDNNDGSDTETDEMDVHEYRKFISKIFPSKYLDKKIKSGEKLKQVASELSSEEDVEEEKQSKKSVKSKNKKNSNRKYVEEDEDEDEDEDENDDYEEEEWETDTSSEEEIVRQTSKHDKNKKKKPKSKKTKVLEESEEEEEDDDEDFVKSNPEKNDNIVAEEFVEGTMINVFWDEITNNWELATRNTLGGKSCFYKNSKGLTFRDMFLQTCMFVNLDINLLNPKYSYSFVLQHPSNRIVVSFENPALYLVEVYEICNIEENKSVNVFPLDMYFVRNMDVWKNTFVKFPQMYTQWNVYDDLKKTFANTTTPYTVLGFILKNKETNTRTKYRNPLYEIIRRMRGNVPNLQYQYLLLRKTGEVSVFLKYYPEYIKEFYSFRMCLHKFTNELYYNYNCCYIRKEKELKEFPENYRTHMFNIHKKYLEELKPNSLYVSNVVVINYVNMLDIPLQMYSINYNNKR
jgi:chemotaxis protein histidine kinase CheA